MTQSIEEALDVILKDPLRGIVTRNALGFVGLDFPPDLLLAGARYGCHLPWDLTRPTPQADAWLESSFPAWARSVLEDWARGRFDALARVLFTRGEDVSQRLYYYVCELQRRGKIAGPRAHILDIARIDRASSHRYSQDSLRRLMQQLELTDAELVQGTQQANELRARFATAHADRHAPGSVYEKLVRASLFADVRPLLDAWRPPARSAARGRLVLAGSSPPDDRIHQCIETLGWQVADEFYDRNLERLGAPVRADAASAVQAVMQSWLQHTFLARDLKNPEGRLQTMMQQGRATAAILWFARDDEALAWQVPRLRRALDAAGVPHLILSARAWDFTDGADQAIRDFLQGLAP